MMRLEITLTSDDGQVFAGAVDLTAAGIQPSSAPETKSTPVANNHIDLQLPLRAFIKKHASRLGGPAKFTLLMAHMAKGDTAFEVSLEDLKSEWNRMTELMDGPFNPSRTTRAKDNGWVVAPRFGFYKLGPLWMEAFGRDNK